MSNDLINLDKIKSKLEYIKQDISKEQKLHAEGKIIRSVGLTLECSGFKAPVGTICKIQIKPDKYAEAVVTGFATNKLYLMPTRDIQGLEVGAKVYSTDELNSIIVSDDLLGRVLDGAGEPLDKKSKVSHGEKRLLISEPMNPLERTVITEPLDVGVRAINSMLTVGKGQRIGLFAGSGVGKSVLLGMMAKYTKADVIVVSLIGERSREVNDFILHNLGPEGLKRAIVIASPADYSPVLRYNGADLSLTIAEYFRDQGKDVLLLMDSLTRYAQAKREIALANGEPPATKGYPPSVFAALPQLVERAGMGIKGGGSITGIFTVLAEGDDVNDPVVDSARAILDGHIMLTREYADKGHYPAIDIEKSVSRVMAQVTTSSHQQLANRFKRYYNLYRTNEDLINIGAYAQGTNPELDFAIQNIHNFDVFLRQSVSENVAFDDCVARLQSLFNTAIHVPQEPNE